MLTFKPAFSLSPFTLIKRLFSSSLLSAIRVVSYAYLRLLIFLLAIFNSSLWFIQPCISHDVPCIEVKYIREHYIDLYSFSSFESTRYSMSSPNCCFLIHIQFSQETGKVVWYSHIFKNFPQFVVIHTVEGFSVVNEVDVFLKFSCFLHDPANVGNLVSGSSAFSKLSLYIWKFSIQILVKVTLKDFERNLLAWEVSAIVQ